MISTLTVAFVVLLGASPVEAEPVQNPDTNQLVIQLDRENAELQLKLVQQNRKLRKLQKAVKNLKAENVTMAKAMVQKDRSIAGLENNLERTVADLKAANESLEFSHEATAKRDVVIGQLQEKNSQQQFVSDILITIVIVFTCVILALVIFLVRLRRKNDPGIRSLPKPEMNTGLMLKLISAQEEISSLNTAVNILRGSLCRVDAELVVEKESHTQDLVDFGANALAVKMGIESNLVAAERENEKLVAQLLMQQGELIIANAQVAELRSANAKLQEEYSDADVALRDVAGALSSQAVKNEQLNARIVELEQVAMTNELATTEFDGHIETKRQTSFTPIDQIAAEVRDTDQQFDDEREICPRTLADDSRACDVGDDEVPSGSDLPDPDTLNGAILRLVSSKGRQR